MNTIQGPFSTLIASDIIRDGLGVELLADGETVAEVFRSDAEHTLTINTFGKSIPLVAIEQLIVTARKRLDIFEDGTPLPEKLG